MPRYFFHMHDGEDRPDLDGTTLANHREARSEAVVRLGEIMRELDGEFWGGPHKWVMTVLAEDGERVAALTVGGEV